MDISQAVQLNLKKLIKSAKGLQLVMLTDSTGLVIAKVSRIMENIIGEPDFGFEGIGALASAMYISILRQGDEVMNLGSLGFLISEFSNGKLIIQGISDFVLIGVTRPRANIRRVREAIRRYKNELTHQIHLLKTSQIIEKHQNEKDEKRQTLEELKTALSELDF